jgi:hypothetical protein
MIPKQGVDLLNLDTVQTLNSRLDLGLVGALVNDEDQGVVILNLLHRRLYSKHEHNFLQIEIEMNNQPVVNGWRTTLWLSSLETRAEDWRGYLGLRVS